MSKLILHKRRVSKLIITVVFVLVAVMVIASCGLTGIKIYAEDPTATEYNKEDTVELSL